MNVLPTRNADMFGFGRKQQVEVSPDVPVEPPKPRFEPAASEVRELAGRVAPWG